jgi:hypothetical protein
MEQPGALPCTDLPWGRWCFNSLPFALCGWLWWVVAAILESDIVANLVLGEGGDWTIGNGAFGPVMAAILESDIVAHLVLVEGGDWTIGNGAFFRDDLDDFVGIL